MERSTNTLAVKSQKWLVHALLSLIQKKPYSQITISELCREADVDRRTFYRNFKDKDDVMLLYFSDLEKEYLLALENMPDHTFNSLAKVCFDFWTQHLDFFKRAQKDQTLNVILLQVLNSFIPSVYAGAAGNITKALQYNIAFVVGGIYNVLIQWVSTGFQETSEEIAAIVSHMFKDTISFRP